MVTTQFRKTVIRVVTTPVYPKSFESFGFTGNSPCFISKRGGHCPTL